MSKTNAKARFVTKVTRPLRVLQSHRRGRRTVECTLETLTNWEGTICKSGYIMTFISLAFCPLLSTLMRLLRVKSFR